MTFLGYIFNTLDDDLEMVFCACDEQFYDGINHGSDGLLSTQEFFNPNCQVEFSNIVSSSQ